MGDLRRCGDRERVVACGLIELCRFDRVAGVLEAMRDEVVDDWALRAERIEFARKRECFFELVRFDELGDLFKARLPLCVRFECTALLLGLRSLGKRNNGR